MDGRIVTPSGENIKSIAILSINYELKAWKKYIYKDNTHNTYINSFIELNNNRPISCSDDKTFKIWSIKENDLTKINTLSEHKGRMNKIVSLNNNKFASASSDKTIMIWNSENPYNIIKTLTNRDKVGNFLCIK